jgi:hypothetical protein
VASSFFWAFEWHCFHSLSVTWPDDPLFLLTVQASDSSFGNWSSHFPLEDFWALEWHFYHSSSMMMTLARNVRSHLRSPMKSGKNAILMPRSLPMESGRINCQMMSQMLALWEGRVDHLVKSQTKNGSSVTQMLKRKMTPLSLMLRRRQLYLLRLQSLWLLWTRTHKNRNRNRTLFADLPDVQSLNGPKRWSVKLFNTQQTFL